MSSILFERVRWKEIKNKMVQVGLQHYQKLIYYTQNFYIDGYICKERKAHM